eukprot:1973425-Prymnesium_polylepis.1
MPHECRPCRLQRTCTAHRVIPPPHSPTPGTPRRRPGARALARPATSHPCVCAQSRPRDDPGVPRPRGVPAGGHQTAPPRRAAGCVPPRTSPRRA